MLSEAKHLIFGEKKGTPRFARGDKKGVGVTKKGLGATKKGARGDKKGARGDKKGSSGRQKSRLWMVAGLYKNIFETASILLDYIKNF
jgi:hypothetical protein